MPFCKGKTKLKVQEMKKVALVLSSIIVFALVFFIVRYFNCNPYAKRIEWTRISLGAIRNDISLFYKENGVYPDSLLEIKELLKHKDDSRFSFSARENKEYLSSEEGSFSESTILSNEGGWFYDSKTGQLKINLNKPLHTYFPHYYYGNRNKIPAEW